MMMMMMMMKNDQDAGTFTLDSLKIDLFYMLMPPGTVPILMVVTVHCRSWQHVSCQINALLLICVIESLWNGVPNLFSFIPINIKVKQVVVEGNFIVCI